MTLYLTHKTTPEMIREAAAGLFHFCHAIPDSDGAFSAADTYFPMPSADMMCAASCVCTCCTVPGSDMTYAASTCLSAIHPKSSAVRADNAVVDENIDPIKGSDADVDGGRWQRAR